MTQSTAVEVFKAETAERLKEFGQTVSNADDKRIAGNISTDLWLQVIEEAIRTFRSRQRYAISAFVQANPPAWQN